MAIDYTPPVSFDDVNWDSPMSPDPWNALVSAINERGNYTGGTFIGAYPFPFQCGKESYFAERIVSGINALSGHFYDNADYETRETFPRLFNQRLPIGFTESIQNWELFETRNSENHLWNRYPYRLVPQESSTPDKWVSWLNACRDALKSLYLWSPPTVMVTQYRSEVLASGRSSDMPEAFTEYKPLSQQEARDQCALITETGIKTFSDSPQTLTGITCRNGRIEGSETQYFYRTVSEISHYSAETMVFNRDGNPDYSGFQLHQAQANLSGFSVDMKKDRVHDDSVYYTLTNATEPDENGHYTADAVFSVTNGRKQKEENWWYHVKEYAMTLFCFRRIIEGSTSVTGYEPGFFKITEAPYSVLPFNAIPWADMTAGELEGRTEGTFSFEIFWIPIIDLRPSLKYK